MMFNSVRTADEDAIKNMKAVQSGYRVVKCDGLSFSNARYRTSTLTYAFCTKLDCSYVF